MRWVILKNLADIILKHRRGCIVEIGVGTSTIILLECAKLAKVKFYTCDKQKNRQFEYNNHTHFLGTSIDFIKIFNDKPSVVFLDGCHDYNIVLKELNFFLDNLIEGGVIFLHDTLPPEEKYLVKSQCSDSYRIRQEFENRKDIVECFTWPYTAADKGLTMILKKSLNRPYYLK